MVKNIIFIKKSPKIRFSSWHQSTITMSSPRLAENLAVNKNIGTMSSPRLAKFSAVNSVIPSLAKNSSVKIW